MSTAREDIIRVAKSYLGAKGGSIAHSDIIHIFNSVKPQGYTAKKTDPWCAEFASACAIQAFGKKTAQKYFPLSAGCPTMITRAKALGIFIERDNYIPKKGDFILYDWDDTGKGDNTNSPDHVGIVDYVKSGQIHVIEGNYHDTVKRRTINVDGKYIRGFVTPQYDKIKSNVVLKSDTEIVKEVLSGDWGNGEQRKKALTNSGYDYTKIQKEVTRITKLTNRALKGEFGTGKERKTALGADYDIVQWNINRIYDEKEKNK